MPEGARRVDQRVPPSRVAAPENAQLKPYAMDFEAVQGQIGVTVKGAGRAGQGVCCFLSRAWPEIGGRGQKRKGKNCLRARLRIDGSVNPLLRQQSRNSPP
ncbi:hypothetical protein Pve01_71470 [Planomonospora venezuelensis]|nr:hypothetical protein Pve01_71470 [Planomonospora venezuelensis]